MARTSKTQINSGQVSSAADASLDIDNSTVASPPLHMTYEEFLDWADEDTLAEWVDGEIIMTSPASFRHQKIMLFLTEFVNLYVEFKGLGEVLPPPFQMKITKSGREPDLIFVKKEHLNILKNTYLNGPADLVVEIVSPESAKRDRQTKLTEYQEAGIPEYWLIDAIEDKATFYQLDENGKYQAKALDEQGRYFSISLEGLWLRPSWLWQQPTPRVNKVLRKVAGPEYSEDFNQLTDDDL